jgi:hypothetical protein
MFSHIVPAFAVADNPANSKNGVKAHYTTVQTVAKNVESLMKDILTNYFFNEFYLTKNDDEETPSEGMKLLYGVLCKMFDDLFKNNPDRGSSTALPSTPRAPENDNSQARTPVQTR